MKFKTHQVQLFHEGLPRVSILHSVNAGRLLTLGSEEREGTPKDSAFWCFGHQTFQLKHGLLCCTKSRCQKRSHMTPSSVFLSNALKAEF